MLTISVVILSTALLLALVLNLALKPAVSARLTTWCMVVSLIGGLLVYGVGFAESTGSVALSVLRTPLAVIRMFVGVNELSAIADTSLVRGQAALTVFWLLHLLAFYSMASAAMITIGAEALRQLRMLLSRRGDLTLIYGVNGDSIALGKACLAERGGSVVFVAESAAPGAVTELNNLGMSVLTGQGAVASDDRTLRRLRAAGRRLSVYALDEREDRDLFYALHLKDALQRAGAAPENTRLTLPGAEEILAAMLQVSEESYGFGYVNVFDKGLLSARALIRTCPPWDFVRFGPDGRAQEDFDCAVVGFGRYGQAVLRQLVMNGQFAGGSFHAAVFSPNYHNESGFLFADSPELLRRYDIRGYEEDGRSLAFYEYIASRLDTLKLIAVCTGDAERDREISDNLMLFLKRRRAEHVCVVRCGAEGVRYQESVGSPIVRADVYTPAMLSAEEADRDAITLNAVYDESDRSDWEKWIACDSFSKMSSRASADFLPALLKAAGATRETLEDETWLPDASLLEALGETEHLRWCAFHYAMGYAPMSRERFAANAAAYARQKAAGLPCTVKIAKDAQERLHACLIPWDELDELSERENAATGRGVDYKKNDINNVLAMPRILRAGQK
ncbi:MAG: hypothetical protein IJ594_02540 [Oscillospiraceae bacterium]|nr:hypothetical protein [Oscillospiraceae bacterium]